MKSNKLKLNTDKTEVMPVGSASRLGLVSSESADIGGNIISFKSSVKYLGVQINQTLSMQPHINNLCRASFLELRRIASVRPSLSKNATARLVLCKVISQLDYCDATFAGISSEQILRLQRNVAPAEDFEPCPQVGHEKIQT